MLTRKYQTRPNATTTAGHCDAFEPQMVRDGLSLSTGMATLSEPLLSWMPVIEMSAWRAVHGSGISWAMSAT